MATAKTEVKEVKEVEAINDVTAKQDETAKECENLKSQLEALATRYNKLFKAYSALLDSFLSD